MAWFVSQMCLLLFGVVLFSSIKSLALQVPAGLLHPVEIPHASFEVWSMDFITDLPPCGDFNGIYTCFDKLMKFVKLIPVLIGEGALSAPEVARLFFKHVVQLFGILRVVLHDHDARFTSPLLALFVGIVEFLGGFIIGLLSTVRWADQTYSSDSGIGYPLCFGLAGVP